MVTKKEFITLEFNSLNDLTTCGQLLFLKTKKIDVELIGLRKLNIPIEYFRNQEICNLLKQFEFANEVLPPEISFGNPEYYTVLRFENDDAWLSCAAALFHADNDSDAKPLGPIFLRMPKSYLEDEKFKPILNQFKFTTRPPPANGEMDQDMHNDIIEYHDKDESPVGKIAKRSRELRGVRSSRQPQ